MGLDPLVKAIGVSENDNTLVDMAIQILTDLADKYDVAIDLLHHVGTRLSLLPGVAR